MKTRRSIWIGVLGLLFAAQAQGELAGGAAVSVVAKGDPCLGEAAAAASNAAPKVLGTLVIEQAPIPDYVREHLKKLSGMSRDADGHPIPDAVQAYLQYHFNFNNDDRPAKRFMSQLRALGKQSTDLVERMNIETVHDRMLSDFLPDEEPFNPLYAQGFLATIRKLNGFPERDITPERAAKGDYQVLRSDMNTAVENLTMIYLGYLETLSESIVVVVEEAEVTASIGKPEEREASLAAVISARNAVHVLHQDYQEKMREILGALPHPRGSTPEEWAARRLELHYVDSETGAWTKGSRHVAQAELYHNKLLQRIAMAMSAIQQAQ